MSLAETQELMRTMQELMAALNNVEAKTAKLNADLPKTKETLGTYKEIERIALRYLVLARRLGLPDDVARATQILSELVLMIRMAQMSYDLLIKGTPYGLLMGIAGATLTAMSATDFMMNPGG